MVGLSESDGAAEKSDSKRGTIYPYDPRCLKIILTLLTKVVAIHVRFSGIDIWGLSFK